MDGQLRRVEVKDTVPVYHLPAERIVVADLVDLPSGILRQLRHHLKRFLSPQGKISTGDIQTGQQQIGTAGRLRQVDDLPDVSRMHFLSDQQERTLRQTSARFMHTHRRDIRSRLHCRNRKIFSEIKMCPVCLISQNFHPFFVRHLHNRLQVGTDAVICRVVDKHRHRIRILLDRPLHIRALHPQRDSQSLIHVRIDIDRLRPAEHHCIDRAAVHISRKNDLVPFLAAGQDHGLDGRSRSAHHQECVFRSECVRRQFFRLLDDRYRVAQIVKGLHGIHVDADAPFPEKLHQLWIAPSVLMPRHIKGHDPVAPETFKRLIDRRSLL